MNVEHAWAGVPRHKGTRQRVSFALHGLERRIGLL